MRKIGCNVNKQFITRLSEKVKKRIQKAVSVVGGAANWRIKFIRPGRQTYNEQINDVNCGIYACLIAEAFLMHLHMYIENISIYVKRQRIIKHVLALFSGDECSYDKPNQSLATLFEVDILFAAAETAVADIMLAEVSVDSLTNPVSNSSVTVSPSFAMVLRKRNTAKNNLNKLLKKRRGAVEYIKVLAVQLHWLNICLYITIVETLAIKYANIARHCCYRAKHPLNVVAKERSNCRLGLLFESHYDLIEIPKMK